MTTRFDAIWSASARAPLEHTFGESVTYTARRTDSDGDADDTSFTATAIRQTATFTAGELGTEVTMTIGWSIKASAFTDEGLKPAVGDTITDSSGRKYSVSGWDKTGLDSQWDLRCAEGVA